MALRDVFLENSDRRYIMFGGKGGLGKTTFSAATAYWLANQGKRVLVFSVDPQASLSDIFQQDIFGKGPVPIQGGSSGDYRSTPLRRPTQLRRSKIVSPNQTCGGSGWSRSAFARNAPNRGSRSCSSWASWSAATM